jgi:hypothetical protein
VLFTFFLCTSYYNVLHCIGKNAAQITPANERDTVEIRAPFLGRPPPA